MFLLPATVNVCSALETHYVPLADLVLALCNRLASNLLLSLEFWDFRYAPIMPGFLRGYCWSHVAQVTDFFKLVAEGGPHLFF